MVLEDFCFSHSFGDTGVPHRAVRDHRDSPAMGGVLSLHGGTSAHRSTELIGLEKSIIGSNLCHVKCLQGWWQQHLPGQPISMSHHPFPWVTLLRNCPWCPTQTCPECLCPHQSMAGEQGGSAPSLGCLQWCWTSKKWVSYAEKIELDAGLAFLACPCYKKNHLLHD